MDEPTLDRLIEVIAAWSGNSGSDDCVAFYSPLATGEFDDVPFVVETRIDAIKQLVDAEAGRSGTPTNWWPADRSWFVYTDWDLWTTKVSGPQGSSSRSERTTGSNGSTGFALPLAIAAMTASESPIATTV